MDYSDNSRVYGEEYYRTDDRACQAVVLFESKETTDQTWHAGVRTAVGRRSTSIRDLGAVTVHAAVVVVLGLCVTAHGPEGAADGAGGGAGGRARRCGSRDRDKAVRSQPA